jgi:tetratricopeptide (TPR) repeat protein
MPTCFVIMPILREGTPEHVHFRNLYDVAIKPTLTAMGYEVKRADEVQDGGSITKDIVLRLAEADLVVADLTDLNPNVFYELGVRHVFRRSGTVIIADDSRTKSVPFDLNVYRVLWYRGDLSSLDELRRELEAFAKQQAQAHVDHIDNPVHEVIPSLPPNALKALDTTEGQLRQQLAEAEKTIQRYQVRSGLLPETIADEVLSPVDIVTKLIEAARQDSLPQELFDQAMDAARNRQRQAFLTIMRKIMERHTRHTVRQLLTLIGVSDALGLGELTTAIYDYALELYPGDKELRESQLGHFAHSDEPADRERARRELLGDLGITITGDTVQLPASLDDDGLDLIALAEDAYHTDHLSDEQLAIAQAVATRFPEKTIAVRNYGRALEDVGRKEEALEYYRKALWCNDVDDTSAVWLGNEAHNRGRVVDAVEAYLCACILDPDDGAGFSHVADDISNALRESQKTFAKHLPRPLPDEVTRDTVRQALIAAFSCSLMREPDTQRCLRAAAREDIDIQDLVQGGLDSAEAPARMGLNGRQVLAADLYDLFRSELTDPRNLPGNTPSTSMHRALTGATTGPLLREPGSQELT